MFHWQCRQTLVSELFDYSVVRQLCIYSCLLPPLCELTGSQHQPYCTRPTPIVNININPTHKLNTERVFDTNNGIISELPIWLPLHSKSASESYSGERGAFMSTGGD
jgi:hypothetical protein